jgi:photosystem II stability/assembly factor-like uncharacterized protein
MRQRFVFSILIFGVIFVTLTPARAQWMRTNGPPEGNVLDLTVLGTNLFAGTDSSVFRTTDNGRSWSAIKNGLANNDVMALAVSNANLFAGTAGGVFRTTDSGGSWTAESAGMTNSDVYAIAVSGSIFSRGLTVTFFSRQRTEQVGTKVDYLTLMLVPL